MALFKKYYSMNKKLLLFIIGIYAFIFIQAAPFKNLETKVTQPDGSELLLYASGDEYYHWVHDKDGYTILLGEDGYCYYAEKNNEGKLVSSNYRVDSGLPANSAINPWIKISEAEYLQRVEKRKTYEKLQLRSSNPQYSIHKSTLNNIVIFISFPDAQKFSKKRSVYDSRFNSTTSSSGSMKDYYLEVSYGNLIVESTFFPEADINTDDIGYIDFRERNFYRPYNATTNKEGYRTDEESTNREHNLIVNAIDAMRKDIEAKFTPEEIDANNDGYVDNVCFVVQGNSDGWSDLLWAHRWSLHTRECFIHGKRVMDYVFQPENQVTTNTICHEMFHALGAPDLYHYREEYQNLVPVGNWDIMGSGWCHMGAYMKWKYAQQNWVTEMPVITTSGTYSLKPLTDGPDNVCYRVNSTNPNEFYVLEYRKKEGKYEKNLRRSGLLIYRIIPSISQGNRNGPPDEVYLYRPYGSLTENGFIDEAAYLTNKGPVMTNITFPKPFLSDNSDGGLRITNLNVTENQLTFDIEIQTTGIKAVDDQKKIQFYADTNTLVLESVDDVQEVTVMDMSGNIIRKETVSVNNISLDYLAKGIYIASVKYTTGKTFQKKIIIK